MLCGSVSLMSAYLSVTEEYLESRWIRIYQSGCCTEPLLGPLAETSLRQSLLLSQGDVTVFVTRPISATFIILAVVVIISSYFRIKKAMEKEQQNAFPAEGQD